MKYKNEEFELTDELIDIGYMAENVDVEAINGKEFTIKKANANRMIQIFLSFPNFEDFKEEILAFDEFMSEAKVEIFTYIFFNSPLELPKFKKIIPVFDINNEFGDMYGTKIVSGTFVDKLTKALFIIGKDGAIYHIDMPNDLETLLDVERIRVELNKVYQSYTGVGCHG
ncbi:hypothetical protein [Halarcobacter ebronensis]|uniref:Redoxin domain-containing protein n=1 Tax=Halarcobacter ebronensis TaxID=1462615 RepID=A0A4Q1B068_9BACT|nr:hypothetical protein [Halarcobacter ebronensis]QKF80567.1 hypothetical protein AEBR_0049 [Halarcobacter ebronensis]RXK08373.1 hypothetical protein CRV07_00790 [Halarcobacter ebronensis]